MGKVNLFAGYVSRATLFDPENWAVKARQTGQPDSWENPQERIASIAQQLEWKPYRIEENNGITSREGRNIVLRYPIDPVIRPSSYDDFNLIHDVRKNRGYHVLTWQRQGVDDDWLQPTTNTSAHIICFSWNDKLPILYEVNELRFKRSRVKGVFSSTLNRGDFSETSTVDEAIIYANTLEFRHDTLVRAILDYFEE